MVQAYERLHSLGHCHSLEVWHDGQLAGGIYGVAIGGFFAGESMFSRVRDASKVALVHLVNRLRERFSTFRHPDADRTHATSGGSRDSPKSVLAAAARH